MIETILGFLVLSIILYCLFGGADYGAGILELFVPNEKEKDLQKVISSAIGPVWEANHIWLIIAIVILFTAFPKAFFILCTAFHLPILAMLVGITLRGCAFSFRHYDALTDETSQSLYSRFFQFSSLFTPFVLGVIAAGFIRGRIFLKPQSFYEGYVAPWLSPFCFSLGALVVSLFTYLAAAYLVGESKNKSFQHFFVRAAFISNVLAVFLGGAVFFSAHLEGIDLTSNFFTHPFSMSAMILGTLLLLPMWKALRKGKTKLIRVIAALQVSLIVLGWFGMQFPILAETQGQHLSVYALAAPEATLKQLLIALFVGVGIIIPCLGFLFVSHQRRQVRT